MPDAKAQHARQFILAVQALAKQYDLPYFIVTEGASAISNNGCDAIEQARKAHIEWEMCHGIDPSHDWARDIINEA